MTRSLVRALITAPLFLLLFSLGAFAQGQFVYVNDNFPGTNTVSAYSVGPNCALTPIGTFSTGGAGMVRSGGANMAEVCGDTLYAANVGSNTLTVFSINPTTGALNAVGSPTPVPGEGGFSISCTPDGRFLYVARSHSYDITVFSRNSEGSLTFVQTVSSGGSFPLDAKVSPTGAFLLVSNSEPDTLVPFTINPVTGTLTQGSPASTGSGSGEIDINCAGTLAFVGSLAGVNVFSIGAGGALTPVQGSPFQGYSGSGNSYIHNVQLSPNDNFLFVGSSTTNTISVLSVGANGALTEVPGSPFLNEGGRLTQSFVTSASGTCLFVFNADVGATTLSVGPFGQLTTTGSSVGATNTTGGIAAYPAQKCGSGCVSPPADPTQPCSKRPDTTGVFRPSNGTLYLKSANDTGFADVLLTYGLPGDYPVAGDWDGDGTDSIGIYRDGTFYLRNSNTNGFADVVVAFGSPGDQPVVGDWDGDGVDTIGVYRNGTFYLRNSNTAGAADVVFELGIPGDVGIAGDWDGDGVVTTGVFRPTNGALYLKNSNATGFADLVLTYGLPGDKPVVGDWDGDGTDTIGVYRGGTFYLRNSNTNGFADVMFTLGVPEDHPISGDWNGLP